MTVREIYAVLVAEVGLSPGYVLDKMEFYEVEALLTGLSNRYKVSWEQTRMMCYIMAQANCTKALEPTDILKFPWDEDTAPGEDAPFTEADKERLKKKSQQFINEKKCQQT